MYNDFAMAIWGPKGLYMRNDVFLYSASVGANPRGGRLAASIDQNVWVDSIKLSFVSDWKLLGGTFGSTIVIPVIINVDVSRSASARNRSIFRTGSTSGLADMALLPFQLNWVWGDHHLTFAPGLLAPTGSYDKNRLLNVGRNYWAFDPAFSYTWLHPTRGHEVSLTAGFFINMRNPATDYRTGSEFHLDWLLGQHFSKQFAVGATGYCYIQVTDDQGPLPLGLQAKNFDAQGAGIGPAVLYTPNIFGRDANLIFKWVHDVYEKRRLNGDLFMLSVALKVF